MIYIAETFLPGFINGSGAALEFLPVTLGTVVQAIADEGAIMCMYEEEWGVAKGELSMDDMDYPGFGELVPLEMGDELFFRLYEGWMRVRRLG